MSLIDTYQIATCGQNSYNTFTLASNGILVDVEIVDLPPIIIPPVPDVAGGGDSTWTGTKETKKTRKKIIVTATVNGVKYVEEKIVENKPKLSIKDIQVNVTESKSKKAIIEINVK